MSAKVRTKLAIKTVRRPLYDSVWLALFELLREELALRGGATFSRADSLSLPQ